MTSRVTGQHPSTYLPRYYRVGIRKEGWVPAGARASSVCVGRTHRPRLGRLTPSGHPCCHLPSTQATPPLTDCRPPCHHSRQPRLHLFLSSCTARGTAPHLRSRARQSIGLNSNARPRPWAMIGCAPAQNRSCGLPTSQPRNLHGSFEVTVTGRWQKPTVAVASVSQAHATSVGSTADLRFATPAPSTVVLWHTPRLDDAWDPPPRRGSPPSTYFVFPWGNTRKACIMQRTRPLPTRYPFCLPIRAVFSWAGRCSVHSRRVQTYRHFKFPLNRGPRRVRAVAPSTTTGFLDHSPAQLNPETTVPPITSRHNC